MFTFYFSEIQATDSKKAKIWMISNQFRYSSNILGNQSPTTYDMLIHKGMSG